MSLVNANLGAYLFGEFKLDLDLHLLARQGRRVTLGSKAFEILVCLVSNAGEVVSKAYLLKTVWADSYVEEGTLSQHISILRKALGDKSSYVVTVPGVGYRFSAPVQHVLPETPTPGFASSPLVIHEASERMSMVIEEPVLPAPVTAPKVAWRYAASAVAAFVVAVVAIRIWSSRTQPGQYVGTVVADFTDTTADATFGRALKRATEIELSQSQFMGVLSDQDTASTLKLMGLKPDTPLTPAIAREVCERTNQQVVLTTALSNIGPEYLLTMDAADCVTGKPVASVNSKATDKSALLTAVDTLAAKMRSKLGESAKSIQHNDVPLAQAATSSLEALRAYSTAQYMADSQGAPLVTLLPLYQKAVELDPQFALSYEAMAGNYYELQEGHLASANYKKAFDLRDRVGESDRLGFEARYYAYALGDAVAGLNAFRAWAAMYPHDYRPWVNISNFDNQLGNPAEAAAAGERAIQINPNYVRAYAVTARAYKNESRFAEAKAVEAEAQRRWPPGVSNTTFEIAFYEHDQATFDRHVKVFEEQQWQLRNYYLAQARSMEGKYTEAKRLLDLEIDEDRKQGKNEIVDGVLVEFAAISRLCGYPAAAHAYLARISKPYLDSDDAALEFALNGDLTYAKRFLAAHEHDQHAPTDQAVIVMPQLRAAVALQAGKPAEALTALEPARPYMAGFMTRTERAMAYMKLGQPAKAAEDYKAIVDGPGAGFGILYPIARLNLARAQAAAGDIAASRATYQSFLAEWKDADPGLPVLQAAKAELARLQ